MSLPIFTLRTARLGPEVVDERITKVVQGLRQREFLKGTVFESRAVTMGLEPYSVLVGLLIGVAATIIVGMLTIELWLPKALARLTGKTITEVTRTVQEVLVGT